MSQIIANTFTAYQQTEEELLSAMSLSGEQKQFIQTQASRIAEERIALTPNPTNYAEFIQQEAYLKGQMEFARYLLDCSTDAEQRRLEAAQNAVS